MNTIAIAIAIAVGIGLISHPADEQLKLRSEMLRELFCVAAFHAHGKSNVTLIVTAQEGEHWIIGAKNLSTDGDFEMEWRDKPLIEKP